MQWIVTHWFEVTTTVLLAVIAVNTTDGKWNNATIVEQLNDLIHSSTSLAKQDAASRRHTRQQPPHAGDGDAAGLCRLAVPAPAGSPQTDARRANSAA
jgi:hypothetical protein